MKGAGKIILIMGMMTSSMVLYVHLHVSLFDVSYQIHSKSSQLSKKQETYRVLKYDVDKLKSPRRLESKMKELNLDLSLPKQIQVIKIDPKQVIQPIPVAALETDNLSQRFSSFVGRWVGVAQANTDQ